MGANYAVPWLLPFQVCDVVQMQGVEFSIIHEGNTSFWPIPDVAFFHSRIILDTHDLTQDTVLQTLELNCPGWSLLML